MARALLLSVWATAALVLLPATPVAALQDDGTLSPAADGTETVRPRMVELVRQGLARPGQPAVWSEMANLLPELARTGDAEVLSAFEAARLADSLSTAPYDPVALSMTAGRTTGATETATGTSPLAPSGPLETLRTRIARTAESAGPILPWTAPWILVAGLAGVLRMRRRHTEATAARGATADPSMATPPARTGREEKLWTVTTLAQAGLPPSEIARRTGMAQDAVRVLMGLGDRAGRPDASTPPSMQGTAPARPRTLGERAAGVSAERAALLRDAAGKMKDRRITYAPRRDR